MNHTNNSERVLATTPNFFVYELSCRHCGQVPLIQECEVFAQRLQELRDTICTPIFVNSWFRCEEHNKNIGGSPNSLHLSGRAADIYLPNHSVLDMFELIGRMPFGGVGAYPTKGFLHLDDRMAPTARWTWTPKEGYLYDSYGNILDKLGRYMADSEVSNA